VYACVQNVLATNPGRNCSHHAMQGSRLQKRKPVPFPPLSFASMLQVASAHQDAVAAATKAGADAQARQQKVVKPEHAKPTSPKRDPRKANLAQVTFKQCAQAFALHGHHLTTAQAAFVLPQPVLICILFYFSSVLKHLCCMVVI